MNLDEVEEEIGETIVSAVRNGTPEYARMAVYYIMEIVKRHRTKGMTRVRARQLANKATQRRIRDEDALHLKEMLNNATTIPEPHGLPTTDAQTAEAHPPDAGAGAGDESPRPVRVNPPRPRRKEDVGPPDIVPDDVPWGGGRFDKGKDYRVPGEVLPPDPGAGPAHDEAPIIVDRTGAPTRLPRSGGTGTYTVCLGCGRLQGQLVAGARKKYITSCGLGPCQR